VIVTLTLNPSLDRTVAVDRLVPGEVNRVSTPTIEPGGKGVNVTRALDANGHPSIAIVPVGGPVGAELARLLEVAGVDARFVPVSGRTRSNLTVSGRDGVVTKINEPGTALTVDDLVAVRTALRATVTPGDWLVVSGSATPGLLGADVSALVSVARENSINVAVDTSGAALQAAIAAGPRIVKPNLEELEEAVGRRLHSMAEVIEAAHALRARGVELVLVSLAEHGAVLVGPRGEIVGESPVDAVVSSIGAGDAFLAGFLSRFSVDEGDLDAALLEALAWGSATCRLPGSAVPGPGDLDPASVQLVWQPDLDRPLLAG
jgi:1-phosphofructokinase